MRCPTIGLVSHSSRALRDPRPQVSTAALPSYSQTSRQFQHCPSFLLRFLALQARSSGSGHCKWDSDWYFWLYSVYINSKS